jgi:hypothetical protein
MLFLNVEGPVAGCTDPFASAFEASIQSFDGFIGARVRQTFLLFLIPL